MSKRKSEFGSIRQLPSGRWQARYMLDGAWHKAPDTFALRRDARAWLGEIEADLRRGDWIDPTAGQITFTAAAEEWLSTVVNLRPSTESQNRTYLRSIIEPAIGSIAVADIDIRGLKQWVAAMVRDGRAPATVKKATVIAGKVLDAAVEDGRIRANPVRSLRGKLPRNEHVEMRLLAPAQIAELADAMAKVRRPADGDGLTAAGDRYGAAVVLAAWTGLRAGELFALRLPHIDLMHRRLSISENVVVVDSVIHHGAPKTAAGRRTMPLIPHVAEAVEEHLERWGTGPDGLLFPSDAGRHYVRLNGWRHRFWVPATKAAGLEGLRIHDIRHTAIALMLAADVPIVEVARRVGHTSPAFTLARYGHVVPGSTVVGDDKLAEMARPAPGDVVALDRSERASR